MTQGSKHAEKGVSCGIPEKKSYGPHLYLARHIDLAYARLQRLHDAAAHERCARWVAAWAVTAGMDAPRGMKLRIRGEFILL